MEVWKHGCQTRPIETRPQSTMFQHTASTPRGGFLHNNLAQYFPHQKNLHNALMHNGICWLPYVCWQTDINFVNLTTYLVYTLVFTATFLVATTRCFLISILAPCISHLQNLHHQRQWRKEDKVFNLQSTTTNWAWLLASVKYDIKYDWASLGFPRAILISSSLRKT